MSERASGDVARSYYTEPWTGPEVDLWIPANGGNEIPFETRRGFRLLWVWNPSTGEHAYLNLANDFILSDEEAFEALGMFD